MNEPPELGEKISLPEEVKLAGRDGNLVLFIGSGISKLLGLPLWEELAGQVLEDLQKKGCVDNSDVEQLSKSLDPRQILSIARSIARSKKVELELEKHFETELVHGSIYETINGIRCVCVTTNYDELLVPAEEAERVYTQTDILQNLLYKPGTVIHLHGCKKDPATMVVTTKDYLEYYDQENIQEFLKHLFQKKTVVFLGYGLGEMEILEYIFRRGGITKTEELKHFSIQGFHDGQLSLYKQLYDYYEETFGVRLLGFAMKHPRDYVIIEGIIKDWAGRIKIQKPLLYEHIQCIQEVLADAQCKEASQKDILRRIEDEPDLQSIFFQQVKGLKWFHLLREEGYFKPEKLPPPRPSEREGYVDIPLWEAAEYLRKTASDLGAEEGMPYCQDFLSILESATEYARANEFSNYQVWWRFAEILLHIPYRLMSGKTIDAVDYWLEDKNASALIVRDIGGKLLLQLLNRHDDHADEIVSGLLPKLFQVSFKRYPPETQMVGKKACFRFDDYWGKKIIEAIALKSGERLGREGVSVFHDELARTLKELEKDEYSSVWQPAIADHEQNKFRTNVENILVLACRNSLKGFVQSLPDKAKEYLCELLDDEYTTIQRIAIHRIAEKRESYNEFWDRIIDEKFFNDNCRYEIWHFLDLNYRLFTEKQKEEVLEIIQKKIHEDQRIDWLVAIKDYGPRESEFYQSEVAKLKAEPKHPDFSTYMTVGKGSIIPKNSPYTKEKLNGLEIADLLRILESSEDSGERGAITASGLSHIFKDAVKSNPSRYFEHLDKFRNLDLLYVNSLVFAYSELWRERAKLPWDGVWHYLLDYILNLVKQEKFWDPDISDNGQQKQYNTKRDNVVYSVGTLINSGVESCDHAFNEKHHDKAKYILKCLLKNQKSVSFEENEGMPNDAPQITFSSPRGRCTKALVNVALRHCRLADKQNNGDHTEVWQEFEQYFNTELNRRHDINYEFFTLISEHIHVFLYMSKDWLLKNLKCIFDPNDRMKWLCVVQGYACMNRFAPEVYQHLKSRGLIIRALDDDGLPRDRSMKFVRDVIYSFLRNEDQLDDKASLIQKLLSREKIDEFHEIIRFICSFESKYWEEIAPKAYELWPRIQKSIRIIGFSSEEGRNLASSLCSWIELFDQIDDETEKWLLEIAPYAYLDPFSGLLGNLARISEQQPCAANKIWQAMIDGMPKDNYGFIDSEEEIKMIFRNLISKGEGGKRKAKEIVEKCIKKGIPQPQEFLSEIINEKEG